MEHVQLDVEVVFEYPDVSNVEFTDEAKLDDAFNCSQGGYEHRGIFGPFGLLVLTDENFQEQTAVYFTLHFQLMVNGPQGFATTRAGMIEV
jgi:beta-fructofuranosidase